MNSSFTQLPYVFLPCDHTHFHEIRKAHETSIAGGQHILDCLHCSWIDLGGRGWSAENPFRDVHNVCLCISLFFICLTCSFENTDCAATASPKSEPPSGLQTWERWPCWNRCCQVTTTDNNWPANLFFWEHIISAFYSNLLWDKAMFWVVGCVRCISMHEQTIVRFIAGS